MTRTKAIDKKLFLKLLKAHHACPAGLRRARYHLKTRSVVELIKYYQSARDYEYSYYSQDKASVRARDLMWLKFQIGMRSYNRGYMNLEKVLTTIRSNCNSAEIERATNYGSKPAES